MTEADAQNVRAWIGVGVAFSELRRLNEAAGAFERAVALAPESADAAYHLAFTLSQLGRYQDGVRAMKRAMHLDSEFAPFRFLLVLEPDLPDVSLEIVANDGITGDAIALMMLSGAKKPNATVEHAVLDDATAARREMAKSLPTNTTSSTPLGAWVAVRRGATPASHRGVQTPAAPRLAVPRPALRPTGEVATVIPRTARGEPGRVRVVPLPGYAVSAEPPIDAAPGVALSATTQASMRVAERALRTALAADADLAQVRVALAGLLRDDGRVQDAEVELVRALDSVPTFHDAARALAELRVDLGRPSDAMQALVRPLRANPRDVDLLVALAEALLALGRDEQVLSAVSRAAALAPDHPGVRSMQGLLAQKQGRDSEAIQHWRLAADGDDGDRWVMRARLALAEFDTSSVPQTPVMMDSVFAVRR